MLKVGDWVKITTKYFNGDYPVGTTHQIVRLNAVSVELEGQPENGYLTEQLELLPEKLVTSKLWKVLK